MSSTQQIPVSIYAEMTPNPAVLKFVANVRLIEMDHVEFKNIEQAQPSPLAVKLFHFPFVKEVFISGNYLAITKYDIVEWEEITLELRSFIRDYLAGGEVVLDEAKYKRAEEMRLQQAQEQSNSGDAKKSDVPTYDAKDPAQYDAFEKRIVELLDEYVAPAVGQDGGHIKFLNFDQNTQTVQVLLQGACSGCPSSTATLKQGILNLLKQMLPGQVQDVAAVNG